MAENQREKGRSAEENQDPVERLIDTLTYCHLEAAKRCGVEINEGQIETVRQKISEKAFGKHEDLYKMMLCLNQEGGTEALIDYLAKGWAGPASYLSAGWLTFGTDDFLRHAAQSESFMTPKDSATILAEDLENLRRAFEESWEQFVKRRKAAAAKGKTGYILVNSQPVDLSKSKKDRSIFNRIKNLLGW